MDQTQTSKRHTSSGAIRTVAMTVAALWLCGSAHAQTASTSFGVTVLLRTFSEAATSDHRCTHRGQPEGRETLRISCPAAVDVQAVANVAAGWAMQHQRTSNAEPYQDRYRLTAAAGKLPSTAIPMELTISW